MSQTPGRLRLAWVAVLGLGAVTCSAPDSDAGGPSRDPLPRGLVPMDQAIQPTEGPHLAEPVLHRFGEQVFLYVANSNDTVATYEVTPAGTLVLTDERAPGVDEVRCTTLAIHEPSASLYCGNDDVSALDRYSLADPTRPVRDGQWPLYDDFRGLAADLEVHGDRLLIGSWDLGLVSMGIGPDGQLDGELVEAGIEGNFRRLTSAGEGRVWALTADRGVLMLEHAGAGAFTELAQLPIDGPAMDLGFDQDHAGEGGLERAAVALGSMGAQIVEWDGQSLRAGTSVHPPGVVSAADLDGDALAAVTLTGAYLYDLRADAHERVADRPGGGWAPDEPPVAGYLDDGRWTSVEREGSLLHARMFEGELFMTDWNYIERVGVDLDGYPVGIDIQRAAYHAEGDAWIGVGVRNPGAVVQRVELLGVGGVVLNTAELGPFETAALYFPAERFELANPELVIAVVRERGLPVREYGSMVLRRPAAQGWPVEVHGAPAPGEAVPPVTLARSLEAVPGSPVETVTLPNARPERVVFLGSDCAAMWPELDDMAWRMREGDLRSPDGDDAQARGFLAIFDDLTVRGKETRWRLVGLPWGFFGTELPPELGMANPWSDLYEDGFGIHELPGAAHHPTDYELDADGRVIAVEREYRGTHPLWAGSVAPPPE
ncbi:hypothetical protein PPSIR1_12998 [Plesiocystis pacifica SIR-1]|uniref:Lipoprotein n=1 Tax=Plesiocystis pacifica SIR-1 TaxID=391625 RepID=A6G0A4_9BACT|nr:hypothetical protein [Plesiocystis pacifica]EDM80801.1 hypothetical protein PPSIR1_12998 [Plesiocystis pacifica SIR-1]